MLLLEEQHVNKCTDDDKFEESIDVSWDVNESDVSENGKDFFNDKDDNCKEEHFPRHEVDAFVFDWRGKEFDE